LLKNHFFLNDRSFFFSSAAEGPAARINASILQFGKVTSALWGTLDQFIVTGHENGELVQWDLRVNLIVLFDYCY
jgi:hypothetical protein